jgi:hypothetical protein
MVNDRAGTAQLAAAAKAHVLAERTVAKNVWKWSEAIDSVSKGLVAA